MKHFDWQAYDDGSLSREAKALADSALSESSKARSELQGLRVFRQTVRREALQEEVPQARLEAMLDGVLAADRRRPLQLWAPLWAAAAALVLLSLVLIPQAFQRNAAPLQVQLATGPGEILMTDNPSEAREWAADRSGLALPTVSLIGTGEMKSSRADQGWACYDFIINGEHVCLTIRPDYPDLSRMQVLIHDGVEFYTGNGIAWEMDGLIYSLNGEPSGELLELALKMRQECEACPHRKRA